MPFLLFIAFIFLFTGCTTSPVEQPVADETLPSVFSTEITACETACLDARSASQNLGNGPCLLNPIPDFPNYVCDVAHNPRVSIDNQPENQCSAFGEIANHFVEVDSNCEFIQEK